MAKYEYFRFNEICLVDCVCMLAPPSVDERHYYTMINGETIAIFFYCIKLISAITIFNKIFISPKLPLDYFRTKH